MGQKQSQDLDAAWDSVPAAPSIEAVDPVEQLCRLFRGAIAANPRLWRSVDLDGAVGVLASLARARRSESTTLPLELVRQKLVKMYAPKRALQESFVVFAHEAKQVGFNVALPRDFDGLSEEDRRQLLNAFYARVARGGAGTDARTKALAGELIVFGADARSEGTKHLLGVLVIVAGVALLFRDVAGDTGPRPFPVTVPDDAVACTQTFTHGAVLRCVLANDAAQQLASEPADRQRARFTSLRRFAQGRGLADIVVVNSGGAPISPP